MIVWNASFETGHDDIDREHQEICERLNQIGTALQAGASRELIVAMVTLLKDYTSAHFSREEAAMACLKCPLRTDNCAAHEKFSARLERWLEVLTIPEVNTVILKDVHEESCRWIQQHLLQIDSSLRQRGATRAHAAV